MRVRDIMTTNVKTIQSSETVQDAARKLDDHKIGELPVVDESGAVVGIITESDFIGKNETVPHGLTVPNLLGQWFYHSTVEEIFHSVKDDSVSEVMTPNPYTVTSDTPLTLVVKLMLKHKIGRLPVVDDGNLSGMVAKRDVLKAIVRC